MGTGCRRRACHRTALVGVVLLAAACSGQAAPQPTVVSSATSVPDPAPSTTLAPTTVAGAESWCVGVGEEPSDIAIVDPEERQRDPRAGDPAFVYLEAGGEAVRLGGPNLSTASLPVADIRDGPLLLEPNRRSGVLSDVTAGGGLQYQITLFDFEHEVDVVAAQLCVDDGILVPTFVVEAAPEGDGVAHDVTVTASLGGEVLASTDPLSIEVRPPADLPGWHWMPLPRDVGGGPGGQAMRAITNWGGGLAAAGTWSEDAAVWLSPDGETWRRVQNPVLAGPGIQVIEALLPFEDGLIGVGSSGEVGSRDAAIWLSDDGSSWDLITGGTALGGPGSQMIFAAAKSGEGVVAAGGDYEAGEWDAALWFSANGRNWTRVPDGRGLFGGVGSQMLTSVTAWSEGFVAVGTGAPDGGPLVLVSADGRSWERVVTEDPDLASGPTGFDLRVVVPGHGELMVLGAARSADGATVEAFLQPGTGRVNAVVPRDGGLLGVGWIPGWESTSAAVWDSSDGLPWELATLPASDDVHTDAEIWGAAPIGDGIVAVGTVYGSRCRGSSDPCDPDGDAAVWILRER